jgi:hypothetical protein
MGELLVSDLPQQPLVQEEEEEETMMAMDEEEEVKEESVEVEEEVEEGEDVDVGSSDATATAVLRTHVVVTLTIAGDPPAEQLAHLIVVGVVSRCRSKVLSLLNGDDVSIAAALRRSTTEPQSGGVATAKLLCVVVAGSPSVPCTHRDTAARLCRASLTMAPWHIRVAAADERASRREAVLSVSHVASQVGGVASPVRVLWSPVFLTCSSVFCALAGDRQSVACAV